MSRASSSAQCDSIATYVDGLQVKIAEAYQAPKKIALPIAYYSKLPDTSKYSYDFSLEKSVLEKMKDWRKARLTYVETRRVRLEEKRKKEAEKSPAPSSPSPNSKPFPVGVATPASEASIFTPQSVFSPTNNVQNHVNNGIDYSDFDTLNDTSSPFDNMELKTLNDMEELEQVLQRSTTVPTTQWVPNPNLKGLMNEMPMEQRVEIKENEKSIEDFKETEETASSKRTDPQQRIVSLIMEELQKELDRPNAENRRSAFDAECSVVENGSEKLEEDTKASHEEISRILANLSLEDQKLAKRLNDMGFSLSRVTRAIRDLEGQDNKKIVEYLLAIQSLEELGMSEDAAVKALA